MSSQPRSSKKGRLIGPAFVVLWLAAVIAVYFVIVQLKRGGVAGIQQQNRSTAPESPPPGSEQPTDDARQ